MEYEDKDVKIFRNHQDRIAKQQIVIYKNEEFFISTAEQSLSCNCGGVRRYWQTVVYQCGNWNGIYDQTYFDCNAAAWEHEQALKKLLAGELDRFIRFKN